MVCTGISKSLWNETIVNCEKQKLNERSGPVTYTLKYFSGLDPLADLVTHLSQTVMAVGDPMLHVILVSANHDHDNSSLPLWLYINLPSTTQSFTGTFKTW